MAIYERLKEVSKNKGLSIKQVEEAAQLGNGAIYKWKDSNPKLETIEKVAKALNVPVQELLDNTPEIEIMNVSSDSITELHDDSVPEAGGITTRYTVKVTRKTMMVDPETVTELDDSDLITPVAWVSEFSGMQEMYSDEPTYLPVLTYKELNKLDDADVNVEYDAYQIKALNDVRLLINSELQKRMSKFKHVDLWKLVNSSARDSQADANGKTISQQDWFIIYQLLSKYEKN